MVPTAGKREVVGGASGGEGHPVVLVTKPKCHVRIF